MRLRLILPLAGLLALFAPGGAAGGWLLPWRLPLAWAGGVLLASWTSVWAARVSWPAARPGLRDHLRAALRAAGCALIAQAGWALFVLLLLAVGAAGLLLAKLPWLGTALLIAWNATVGLAACLGAAFLAVLAVPAFPLVCAYGAVEAPVSLPALVNTGAWLRCRPLLAAAGAVAAVVSTALALVPFGLVTGLAAGLLLAVRSAAELGAWPEPGQVLAGLRPLRTGDGSAGLLGWTAVTVEGRLVLLAGLAFALASLQSGATRLLLVLRRSVEAVPLDERPADRADPSVPVPPATEE